MAQTFSAQDLKRAWQDEEYRQSLPSEVQEQLPAPPENVGELSDEQLEAAAGAGTPLAAAAWAGGAFATGFLGKAGADTWDAITD